MERITEVVIDLHEIAVMVVKRLDSEGLFKPGTPEHVKEGLETDVFNTITQPGTDKKIKHILSDEIAVQVGQMIFASMADDEEEEGEGVEHDIPGELLEILMKLKRITER